jgi:hypothetical protein
MAEAPCIKDGCRPQSSPPDQGEIRESCGDFFGGPLKPNFPHKGLQHREQAGGVVALDVVTGLLHPH